jgi:Protein of unknown function (DUF2817)
MNLAVFSDSYLEAREKFLGAARRINAHTEFFEHPMRGPAGERIGTDVVRVGPLNAHKLLVVISGTHGIEGFCGSALQTDWLEGSVAHLLPSGSAVLMIHALNPYGFAWHRRVNEDNVDLNRNFLDWCEDPPVNDPYHALHQALVPTQSDGPVREEADGKVSEFIIREGAQKFQDMLTLGQYSCPDGLFYGGTSPTWSNLLFQQLAVDSLSIATNVALLDIHSGLGPYGYGQVFSFDETGSDGLHRAARWVGASLATPRTGNALSSNLNGTLYDGLRRFLPTHNLTPMGIEFGTYPATQGIEVLRAEAILSREANDDSGQLREARRRLRDFFDVRSNDWRELVLFRGRQVIRQVFRGVTAECEKPASIRAIMTETK